MRKVIIYTFIFILLISSVFGAVESIANSSQILIDPTNAVGNSKLKIIVVNNDFRIDEIHFRRGSATADTYTFAIWNEAGTEKLFSETWVLSSLPYLTTEVLTNPVNLSANTYYIINFTSINGFLTSSTNAYNQTLNNMTIQKDGANRIYSTLSGQEDSYFTFSQWPVCSISRLDLCTDYTACSGIGGTFYNNTCYDFSIESYYSYDFNANDTFGTNDVITNENVISSNTYILGGNSSYSADASKDTYSAWEPVNDFSISLWFNTSDTTGALYQQSGSFTDLTGITLWFDAGVLKYSMKSTGGGGTSYTITGTFNDNTWHHLVYRRQNGGNSIWIDNSEIITEDGITGTMIYSTDAGNVLTSVGSGQNNAGYQSYGQYTGYIDELAQFNKYLTNTEISVLYNGGVGLNPLTYVPPVLISGTVKRQDGNNVANATVVILSQTGIYDVKGVTTSAADGTWSFVVGTAGTYTVYAYNATYRDIKTWVVAS